MIIKLRFFEGKTQLYIAEYLKCSQMHVSRLIQDSLKDLKDILKNKL